MTPPEHFSDYTDTLRDIARDMDDKGVVALMDGNFGAPQVGDYAYAADKLLDKIGDIRMDNATKILFGEEPTEIPQEMLDNERILSNIVADTRYEFELRTGTELRTSELTNFVMGADGKYVYEALEGHPGVIAGQFSMLRNFAEHTSFMNDPKYAESVTGFNDFMDKNTSDTISINIPQEPVYYENYSPPSGQQNNTQLGFN